MKLLHRISNFLKNESGQSATEYILILSVIVGVVLAVGGAFKGQMESLIRDVMDKIRNAITRFTTQVGAGSD